MIRILDKKSQMPEALKLASHIATFLFEEKYGELKFMKQGEIKHLEMASKVLQRASTRSRKP